PADQSVPYYNIAVENGTCIQSASVANYSVRVDAGEAPEGYAFSRWTAEPAATFTNDKSPIGFFLMPANDVVITANYAQKKPFTLIDALTPSGEAGIGGIVDIEAAPSKGDQLFRQWEIIEGEGLVIENPYSVATSFTMIDGAVIIAARYATAYMINISGGSAVLEAFEGQTITITADKKANQEFVNWTSDTPGLVFADDKSETTTFVMPAGEVSIRANFKTKENGMIEISRMENVPYTIYNLSGIEVGKGITNGRNIPVNRLSKGIYILKTSGMIMKIRIE
ncbi:MAG: hypothetical protein LBG77_03950, partial [Dysgonamonadaceae bacterium]|nr:hypothetical protein [Dysgonamonadaceae bacterium]